MDDRKGRSGRDEYNKNAHLALHFNLLVSEVLALLSFNGKDLAPYGSVC